MRQRVAALIERDGLMLVVHQRARGASGRHDGHAYRTPPGGGIEPGETSEDAVVREVREEVGLTVRSTAFISRIEHSGAVTRLYEVLVEPGEPELGEDPELECDCPRLVGLEWVPAPPRSVWTRADAVRWLVVDADECVGTPPLLDR